MMKLLNTKCLLDSNILVAIALQYSPFHKIALDFFHQASTSNLQLVVSSQNLLELSSVLIHAFKMERQKVSRVLRQLLEDTGLEIIYPNFDTLEMFILLIKNNTVHTSDIFLAATTLSHKIPYVITDDRDFTKIKEIKVYNPFH